MPNFILILALIFTPLAASAANYFVDPLGNNKNDCLSLEKACKTIQFALNKAMPGDIVLVNTGSYRGAIFFPRSGTESAPITLMPVPGTKPVIKLTTSDWWGIAVPPGISHVQIFGFNIVGSARAVTQAQAEEWARNSELSPANGQSCIAMGGDTNLPPAHHITVANNDVRYCPGAGIYAVHADYVNIIGNRSSYNGWWNWNGPSGISIYESVDIDSNTSYKNFVMNNFTFQNVQKVPHPTIGFTDGNGIIIDKNENTDGTQIPYKGRTYVGNNVSYWNGAAGIITYYSRNVDIVNNTCFQNSRALPRGEIQALNSSDVNVLNNILMTANTRPLVIDGKSTALVWDYNLLFGGNKTEIKGAHDKRANPLFQDAPRENFRLLPSSPAIGLGTTLLAPDVDITGKPRKPRVDAGAYQAE